MINDECREVEKATSTNFKVCRNYGITFKMKNQFLRQTGMKLSVIFVVGLLCSSLSFLSGCDAQTSAPKPSGTTSKTDNTILSDDKICIAGIAKIFSKDPSIINIDSINKEAVYLSYIRPADQKEWKYKCKVSGNRIIWGADTGRWRDSSEDSVVSYVLSEEYISVTDTFGDGSSSNDIFFFVQLGQ